MFTFRVESIVHSLIVFFILAHEQIEMMEQLSKNQHDLQQETVRAIDDLTGKNEQLLNQQKEMADISNAHRAAVQTNLHELMREKSLIRSGQVEVARMIDELKQKLDDSMTSLKRQSHQMKQNHENIQADLSNLQTNALHINDKLGETTEYILSQNEIASAQFDQTVRHMSEIKETAEQLAQLLQTLEGDVNTKLTWIRNKIGDTDLIVSNMNLVLEHLGLLLLGMLLLVFVGATRFQRFFFVTAISVNFACTLYHLRHVKMLQLLQIIAGVFVCDIIRIVLAPFIPTKWFALKRSKSACQTTAQDDSAAHEEHSDESGVYDSKSDEAHTVQTSEYNYEFVSGFKSPYSHIDQRDGSRTPSIMSRRSSISRSITPYTALLNDRIRCIAITMKGDRCRNAASPDALHCRRHEK